MIPVTKPFLPPLDDLDPYLKRIWDTKILSNNGPLHDELEQALASYLGTPHVSLFANATTALVIAQKALGLSGEIITTPYTFVATANSIVWASNKPIFVDIHPECLTLLPRAVEAAITENTAAIMPVHCYGSTCDTGQLEKIAKKNGLKLIYDACHSFGVSDNGGSVLRYGDVSVVSFHATKVFNTFEGAALISSDRTTKELIDRLKNFGFVDETSVEVSGINGKMSEFGAALGLAQLKHFSTVITERRLRYERYQENLEHTTGIKIFCPARQTSHNYCYLPILVGSDYKLSRDSLFENLRDNGIGCRRYFYPLVTDFEAYSHMDLSSENEFPNASAAAQAIICLPLYPDLEFELIDRICRLIAR